MKVPGSDGNDKKLSLLQEGRSVEHGNAQKTRTRGNETAQEHAAANSAVVSDKINVSSLATLLRSELDPTKLADERRRKVDDIKARIANGTYAPPLDQVAKSLSEELSVEILLGAGDKAESEVL